MKIIYGRAGSGKSEYLLRKMQAHAKNGEKSILIVPEQFSFRTEQSLAENNFFGGFVEVLSFTKLAKREIGTLPGGRTSITQSGKTMLMYRAIAKASAHLRTYRHAAAKATLAPSLLELQEEFSHIGVDTQLLKAHIDTAQPTPLSLKLMDLTEIFDRYTQLLQADYVDTDGMLSLCAQALSGTVAYQHTHVYIDAFSDFSAPHFEMITALEACAKQVTVSICADRDLDAEGFFAPGVYSIEKLKKTFAATELVYLKKPVEEGELAHLERSYTKPGSAVYTHACNAIQIYAGRNMHSEIHFAANEILRLCREKQCRFRDFAIVVGDGERYFEAIAYILKRYGIPVFVSAKKSAVKHPIALAILSALEIAERGFQYETVFAYLKSGFSNLEAEDVDFLENYVLATGIGAKHWTKSEAWAYKRAYFEERAEADSLRADALRRRVAEPILKLKQSIGISFTVKQSAQAIYAFMCETGMREKTEAMVEQLRAQKAFAASSIYQSTYNGVIHVLEQLSALCGTEKCGVARLRHMVNAGLLGQNQAIVPQRVDEVVVTDVSQGRYLTCQYLFAMGTNTGSFCGFSGKEGILTDTERLRLRNGGIGVLPTSRHKAFDHLYTVYKTLTAAHTGLYISYAVSDMLGNSMSASPVAAKVRKLFANVLQRTDDTTPALPCSAQAGIEALAKAISSHGGINRVPPMPAAIAQILREENRTQLLTLFSHCADGVVQAKPLSAANIQHLYPNGIPSSVSRLEKYSACPFAYYMSYMLQAQPRKINKIGAPDIGNMVHRALEYFVDEAQAQGQPIGTMPEAMRLALTQRVTQRLTEEMFTGMASVTKASAYFANRLQSNLEQCVKVLVRHIALGKFEPVGSEIRFGDHGDLQAVVISLTNGKKLKIHGMIDRLDKYESASGTYYRVIDYKTGSKSFSMDNIAKGLDFQLMVYMEAALGGDASKKPAAVMYFKIKEPMISKACITDPEEIEAEIRNSMRMDGICLDTPEILQAMDASGTVESEVFHLKHNTNGSISATSAVGSMQLFYGMAKRVRRTLREIGDSILKGEVYIMPANISSLKACEYCAYAAVCRNKNGAAYCKTFEQDTLKAREVLLREGGEDDAMDTGAGTRDTSARL